jgi:hypothetical protein
VGGGDSFASGLIYGLLTADDLRAAVEFGAAHGALAMTTPGDTSMASLAEVQALAAGPAPASGGKNAGRVRIIAGAFWGAKRSPCGLAGARLRLRELAFCLFRASAALTGTV